MIPEALKKRIEWLASLPPDEPIVCTMTAAEWLDWFRTQFKAVELAIAE